MSGGQHRVDEVTRTESRGLDSKNNPRIAAHRPPKETAGLRNAGVCAKGTKKESNTLDVADFVRDVANISNEVGSVKNVSSYFLLFLSIPVCPRSSAWLVALTISFLSVSRSPDRLGPFASSSRCCPPDISSVLADHDEFFELPAPRGGGSPIQGFDHCCAGSCSQAGIPAWAPPCFCRNCPRRQNSW